MFFVKSIIKVAYNVSLRFCCLVESLRCDESLVVVCRKVRSYR